MTRDFNDDLGFWCCKRLDSEGWTDFDRPDASCCTECTKLCHENDNEILVGEPCRVLVDMELQAAQAAAKARGR